MLRKQLGTIFIFFSLVVFGGQFLAVAPALGQSAATEEIAKQLDAAAGTQGAGVGNYTDPRKIVSQIVQILLTLVGTIFFVLTVYAGYLWMTAGGNEEAIEKAKTTLRNSAIGLVIVLAAYAITIAATNLASGRSIGQGTSNGNGPTLEGSINNGLFGN